MDRVDEGMYPKSGAGRSGCSSSSRTGQFDGGDPPERALEGELEVASLPPARTLDLEPDCVAWTKRYGRGELGRQGWCAVELGLTYDYQVFGFHTWYETLDPNLAAGRRYVVVTAGTISGLKNKTRQRKAFVRWHGGEDGVLVPGSNVILQRHRERRFLRTWRRGRL